MRKNCASPTRNLTARHWLLIKEVRFDRPKMNLNFRPHATEKNALPLDQLARSQVNCYLENFYLIIKPDFTLLRFISPIFKTI